LSSQMESKRRNTTVPTLTTTPRLSIVIVVVEVVLVVVTVVAIVSIALVAVAAAAPAAALHCRRLARSTAFDERTDFVPQLASAPYC